MLTCIIHHSRVLKYICLRLHMFCVLIIYSGYVMSPPLRPDTSTPSFLMNLLAKYVDRVYFVSKDMKGFLVTGLACHPKALQIVTV